MGVIEWPSFCILTSIGYNFIVKEETTVDRRSKRKFVYTTN